MIHSLWLKFQKFAQYLKKEIIPLGSIIAYNRLNANLTGCAEICLCTKVEEWQTNRPALSPIVPTNHGEYAWDQDPDLYQSARTSKLFYQL